MHPLWDAIGYERVEKLVAVVEKVVKGIRFADIPKTSTGKIQKFQLRQRACADAAFTHSTPTKL